MRTQDTSSKSSNGNTSKSGKDKGGDKAKASGSDTKAKSDASAEAPAAPAAPQVEDKAALLAAKKKEIEERIAKRKAKEEEDLKALQLLEQGELPPEKAGRSTSGVMSIVNLNDLGANTRAAHRSIQCLDEMITDEELKDPAIKEDFERSKRLFTRLRDQGMEKFAAKVEEREKSGAMMKGLLPLNLKRDDKGNVIKLEHPRKKSDGAAAPAESA